MSKTLHTHVVKKHSFVDDNKHIYAHAMFVTQWYEDRKNVDEMQKWSVNDEDTTEKNVGTCYQ